MKIESIKIEYLPGYESIINLNSSLTRGETLAVLEEIVDELREDIRDKVSSFNFKEVV